MDKYTYEPYPPVSSKSCGSSSTVGGTLPSKNSGSKSAGGQKASLKHGSVGNSGAGSVNGGAGTCHCCFGGAKRSKTKVFLTNLATNLGICFLLFGYTLIGSIIFLAIEGNHSISHQILATTSLATNLNFGNVTAIAATDQHEAVPPGTIPVGVNNAPAPALPADSFKARVDAVRAKTVENIWDITVNLNILYRDNWTRLAEQEMTRFQDELVRSMGEMHLLQQQQQIKHQQHQALSGGTGGLDKDLVSLQQSIGNSVDNFEWTFSKSFLYSLTVLTTIGYGSIAPKTTLGKAVTMGYAILGIPLTLLYLSSVGSILSRIARGVFSRALCCCLCSNCGYCCYDEQRMADKERRMKKKRQQLELQHQLGLQEPFYVRSDSFPPAHNMQSPTKDVADTGSTCTDNDSSRTGSSMQGLSILAPVTLCLAMMFLYICLGTFVLFKLENWSLLDGFYFCFMSLTTIGFGNMLPGNGGVTSGSRPTGYESNVTIWFCSLYIMSGMALTAMCFNVVHDEIIHRLRHAAAAAALASASGHHHGRGTRGTPGGTLHRGAKGSSVTPHKLSFSDDLASNDPYNLTS